MSDKDFPKGRKAEWISWGVSPENGDCLALQKVGSGTCISLEAHLTYHGDYDIPFIVAKHSDGQEVWHRVSAIDSIGWEPAK